MAIKRADGSIINPIKEAEPVMEEIVVNEEVHEEAPAIRVENESDEAVAEPVEEVKENTPERVIKRNISIEAPWWRFYKLLQNLFINDESVTFLNNETKGVFEITVSSSDVCKLAAIKKVVGTERTFGNVKVAITYIEEEAPLTLEEFAAAFKDTGYLVDTKTATTPAGDPIFFPIMKKDVIQFYDDDISDYYGNFNATVAAATVEIMDPKNITPNFLISTAVEEE